MSSETGNARPARARWLALLPFAVFVILAGVFFVQLLSGRDISVVPSALLGMPAPKTNLPPLEGVALPGLDSSDFEGQVTLVNVWASWCAPCRQEHPLLMQLNRDERVRITGINYKDLPQNARHFLDELGNPYDAIGVDESGRTGIEWGVYGLPETFLVDKDGIIVWKHVGVLTPQTIVDALLPEIQKATIAQ